MLVYYQQKQHCLMKLASKDYFFGNHHKWTQVATINKTADRSTKAPTRTHDWLHAVARSMAGLILYRVTLSAFRLVRSSLHLCSVYGQDEKKELATQLVYPTAHKISLKWGNTVISRVLCTELVSLIPMPHVLTFVGFSRLLHGTHFLRHLLDVYWL
jgi:hypothetical protein